MKTKEELQEEVGLVREVESWALTKPQDDTERASFDCLFRKAAADLPRLEIAFVRRINEAVFAVEFPSEACRVLRRACIARLGAHHNLRAYRSARPTVPSAK